MPFGNDSSFPLHDDQMKKWSQRGYMQDFLKARASVSRSFETHDFNRSVTADVTNNWTVAASSTATTTGAGSRISVSSCSRTSTTWARSSAA